MTAFKNLNGCTVRAPPKKKLSQPFKGCWLRSAHPRFFSAPPSLIEKMLIFALRTWQFQKVNRQNRISVLSIFESPPLSAKFSAWAFFWKNSELGSYE